MDEATFAASFPKFMWVPSREVARESIEALAHARGGLLRGEIARARRKPQRRQTRCDGA